MKLPRIPATRRQEKPDLKLNRSGNACTVRVPQRREIADVLLCTLLLMVSVAGLQLAAVGQSSSESETVSAREAHEQTGPHNLDEKTALRLKYQVLGDYLPLVHCDAGIRFAEADKAERLFSQIQRDPVLYHAIAQHLGLNLARAWGPDERFLVYREYQRLNAIQLEASGEIVKMKIIELKYPNCAGLAGQSRFGFFDAKGVLTLYAQFITSETMADAHPPQPSTLPFHDKLESAELRFQLLQYFGDTVFCYPIHRGSALRPAEPSRFDFIRQDTVPFKLILQRLGLPEQKELSGAQQALVVQEYSKLLRIRLEPLVRKFQFKIEALDPKHPFKGTTLFNIDGLIVPEGELTEMKRTPSWSNPCPR